MKEIHCDVLVIGAGPAGLAAATRAREAGAGCVLVVERNEELGGILPQCIHNGFGLRVFRSDLTGPEYAARWAQSAHEAGVEFLMRTMVLAIEPGPRVIATSALTGMLAIDCGALILAMGCRERPRGALAIPGSRPAGVYTAGTAQRLVNMEGHMPGERFVILGSGDIGMIMARRLTLEGAHVAAMAEILPFVSGLRRNLVQCVRDFDIPLHLCTTVTRVSGKERVEGVVLSGVDQRWQPIAGSEMEIACDALLLSVGLIPENELSRMADVRLDPLTGGPIVDETLCTSVPGIYAAGNVVHVYDLVDEVTESALRAGAEAARFVCAGPSEESRFVPTAAGANVHHVVPQHIHMEALTERPVQLELRVREPLEETAHVEARAGKKLLAARRLRYARPSEMIALELPPGAAAAVAEAGDIHVAVHAGEPRRD